MMKKKINLLFRLSDSQIIRLVSPRCRKRGNEPSFRLVIVRCSAGKNGSGRVRCIDGSWALGRKWRGACGVPRTILTAHGRFAGIWGVLGVFGDICSKWHGEGGPARTGGRSKLTRSKVQGSIQDPRSNMNEGTGRLNDRVGWAEVAAAGPADIARSPKFARFGSTFTMGGAFPIKGVLAGSLGIRGIRKDFPIFSAFSDILFRAKNAKENWDKDEGAAEKRGRVRYE